MSSKRLLTIFGATGNQGGSIIDTVLARPELSAKYALRGITRDPSSGKSKALASRGVEVVRAELDDVESLKTAVTGSYGVFGVTDFWAVMSKAREMQQGKNIFAACQAAGVKHFVFSSLPHVSKLSKGKHTLVEHFDGKAEVELVIEAEKKDMIASYFMPAMFLIEMKKLIQDHGQGPTLTVPYPDENIAVPLLEPRRDSGKYIMGLFEAGEKANGVEVQGVSCWTTPKKVVAEAGEALGKQVRFQSISGEVFASFLPEAIRDDLTDMFLWIGEASYFGLGTEKKQAESNKWLVEGADLINWSQFLKEGGPWKV
ncbi:hypothetical protein WHR41_00301 [Cladosporium halotolerans]|uniref:NmrA-like domain-containing protein n=1 Tax=Cladosporium halotolerans TaxID=1052096 RepID=A0AB34L8T8_9PEZI